MKNHPEPPLSKKPLRILHSEPSDGWGGQEHRTFKEMLAPGHALDRVFALARPGVVFADVQSSLPRDAIDAAGLVAWRL
jgi:hypothetical protein